MKPFMLKLTLTLVMSANAFAAPSTAGTQWFDPETGREYLLIPGNRGVQLADRACADLGLALFNPTYLEPSEQQRFLDSFNVSQMKWRTRYRGTPRQLHLSDFWTSSQGGTIASNGFSWGAYVVTLRERHSKRIKPLFAMRGGETRGPQTLCMSVADTWYRCSAEFKCIYDSATTEFSMRFRFAEYGATKTEAASRLVARSEDPNIRINEGICSLTPETMLCHPTLE